MKHTLISVLVLGVTAMGWVIYNNHENAIPTNQARITADNLGAAEEIGEDSQDVDTQDTLVTYRDPITGVSLKYPRDWNIQTDDFGFRLSKNISSKSELMFSVSKIGMISYFPSEAQKTIFLGREAYAKTFNDCAAEGGTSGTACYLKKLEVVMGEKSEIQRGQTEGVDIMAEGIQVTYGVSEQTDSVYGDTQVVYEQNVSVFQSILSSLQID